MKPLLIMILCKNYNKFFMKKISLNIYVIALITAVFTSCNNGGGGIGISNATGRPGELLLVTSNDIYNSNAGNTISEVLQESAPSLPQDEPMFRVSYTTPKNLAGNLKTVRNIMIVEADSTRFTTTSFKCGYDQWAKGQMVMNITSPNNDSISSYFEKNRSAIQNIILRHEYSIIAGYLSSEYSAVADKYVDSLFNYHINVPQDIKKHKFGNNFLWMSNDAVRKRMDFMVYTIPYKSAEDISLDNIVAVRDSVLKTNIKGESDESYPTTEKMVGLLYRKIVFPDGNIRGEVRGLWKMEGPDMMGGPFVCHAFIDKANKKVYFVDAFVYNPNDKKLDLIRVMESSLYTFRPDSIKKFNSEIINQTKSSKYN